MTIALAGTTNEAEAEDEGEGDGHVALGLVEEVDVPGAIATDEDVGLDAGERPGNVLRPDCLCGLVGCIAHGAAVGRD
jgi:hypothetical protein